MTAIKKVARGIYSKIASSRLVGSFSKFLSKSNGSIINPRISSVIAKNVNIIRFEDRIFHCYSWCDES